MEKESLAKIEKIATEFFKLLEVKAKLRLDAQADKVAIGIDGEDLGILIGYHGETLEALQLLLGLIVNRQLGEKEWLRVVLDVGGWRAEREESLQKLTEEAIRKVIQTKQGVGLPPMSASQRRFVHLLIQEQTELESYSEETGPNRHIVITYKNK